jgi:hypothetical protein
MKSGRWQRWRSLRYIVDLAWHLTLVCLLALSTTVFFLAEPVQAQPTVLPSSLPQAQVGASYTTTLVAAPVTCPCTWTITSGSLPPGLTLNAAAGTVSGTPSRAGTYSFFVTVTDTVGASPQQGFFITVASSPISFRTTSLPEAKEGVTYDERIRVSGGTSPYTWTITNGTLPSGLTLEADAGVISGIPARGTAGTHSFTIRVADSSIPAVSGQLSFSITIEKGPYESIVTIAPGVLVGKTQVFVGGKQVATLDSGESTRFAFEPGTSHTVSVPTSAILLSISSNSKLSHPRLSS